nr:SH3 domain-containing protein [Jannaschia sp. S6380]
MHDVAGVAADDVLNIRRAPDARSDIVGRLAPDRRGVEVLRTTPDERWGLVNRDGGMGWVSMRYLDRGPGQWAGAFPEIRACFGTEPFWSLRLDGDVIEWSTPEGAADGTVIARLGATARRDRHGLVATIDRMPMTGILSARACSDGMSDAEWGLALDAVLGAEVLSGCCTLDPAR